MSDVCLFNIVSTLDIALAFVGAHVKSYRLAYG